MADRYLFMMSRLHNRIMGHVKARLAAKGLSLSRGQVGILLALEHHGKERGLLMGELSRILDMDGAAATRLVDRLETLGLAEREANPANRRQIRARLTPPGLEKALVVKAIVRETNQTIEQGISRQDLEAYNRVTRTLLDRFS